MTADFSGQARSSHARIAWISERGYVSIGCGGQYLGRMYPSRENIAVHKSGNVPFNQGIHPHRGRNYSNSVAKRPRYWLFHADAVLLLI
jgi:hypothetical protein